MGRARRSSRQGGGRKPTTKDIMTAGPGQLEFEGFVPNSVKNARNAIRAINAALEEKKKLSTVIRECRTILADALIEAKQTEVQGAGYVITLKTSENTVALKKIKTVSKKSDKKKKVKKGAAAN